MGADAQRVTVKAERVVVPEMLFSPKDHGIHQVGVADLVRHSIRAVTAQSWRPHFGQVVVCGGLARLPNFCSRLFRDLSVARCSTVGSQQSLPTHPLSKSTCVGGGGNTNRRFDWREARRKTG